MLSLSYTQQKKGGIRGANIDTLSRHLLASPKHHMSPQLSYWLIYLFGNFGISSVLWYVHWHVWRTLPAVYHNAVRFPIYECAHISLEDDHITTNCKIRMKVTSIGGTREGCGYLMEAAHWSTGEGEKGMRGREELSTSLFTKCPSYSELSPNMI